MGVIKHAAILTGMALTLGVTALPPAAGWAQSMSGNPMVTGNIIRDFARITFYWPEKIDMSATTNGNKLVVRFDRPVNPDFGEILRSMYPYITKAELAGNQRTIIFTMKEAYKIRSFITDSESGVDILGIYDAAPRTFSAPAPKQAKQPVKPATAPAPKPEPELPPAPKPATQPKTEQTPEPTAAKPSVESSRAVPVIDVQETPVTPPPAQAPIQEAPATTPPQAEAAPSQTKAAMQPLDSFGAVTGAAVQVELSTANKQPQLRFDFNERVAAASWQRGRTVMLWFAKPATIVGLDKVLANSSHWLMNARQLGGSNFTLLQLDLLTDVQMHMFKDREGYGWQTHVSTTPMRPEKSIPAQIVTTSGPAYVFMPVTQAEEIVTITDPQVGDTLSIIPLYSSGTGVYPPRSFVDFDVLQTSQGIVVAAKSDRIRVEKQPNGIRISADDGLFVTESITPEAVANGGGADNRDEMFKYTLFPYREWKVDSMDTFREREAYLLNQITNTSDKKIQNENRLQLAQLYLAQGMYNEANAVLNRIRREDLDFYRERKLAALEGASYLLNYRFQEAALSLSSDTLDNNEEGDLLRKAVAATMEGDAEEVPYLLHNSTYIRQYPPALRQRLALIAANHAIQKGDLRTPTEIFETLEEDKLSGDVANYVDFLKAKIAAESGRIKEAEGIWNKQAAMLDDRQFRARSEYSLVLLGLKEGSLSPEDAIKRLDALRIIWRGDDLERSLLMVLGQLNVNSGNYWDGMKTWEELLEHYPNSPDALEAYQRLARTFRMLYLEDGADKMDPVKALALYSEFQELTPLGDDGNRMIQHMVDRLVMVDLLEQAAARLEHQIEFRLKGEDKSRVGVRLAVIYLLNREPEKALEALQKSREDNVPPGLSLERNRVAAQALIDLKRPDQALTMIEGDFSSDGENVRLEAYWVKEDWAYVIDIIELMLRSRDDLNAPFNEREGQKLLQLALAYIFVGEFDQLRYIRDAYAPLMEGNPYKEEFLFLTEERIQTNSENFSKVMDNISAMESFMDSYRDRLKQSGLSEAVANSADEAADAKSPQNPQ